MKMMKPLFAAALIFATAGAGIAHSHSTVATAVEYEELSYDQDPIGYPNTPLVGRVAYNCDGSVDVWGRPGEYGLVKYYDCP